MTPPPAQARTMSGAVWRWRATTCGLMKMPEPMMPPMTSMVASKGPRRRESCASGSAMRAHGGHDLVAAAAVLERMEAEVAGHEDAAAVRVEGARGIDVEV